MGCFPDATLPWGRDLEGLRADLSPDRDKEASKNLFHFCVCCQIKLSKYRNLLFQSVCDWQNYSKGSPCPPLPLPNSTAVKLCHLLFLLFMPELCFCILGRAWIITNMLVCVQLSQESIICKKLKYILYLPQENYYKMLQTDDIIVDCCWWIKAKDLLN